MAKRKAVFLDRDGVINRVIMREKTPGSPRNLREFRLRRGAADFVRRLKRRGFAVFVVTNQPDLARGLLDPGALTVMHDRIRRAMPVDGILVCPHDDRARCRCRKPLPGMIFSAAREKKIDLARSFFLGDGGKDMAAGKAAGCTAILLQTEYNRGVEADQRARSFAEAEKIICGPVRRPRAFRSRGPFRSAGGDRPAFRGPERSAATSLFAVVGGASSPRSRSARIAARRRSHKQPVISK